MFNKPTKYDMIKALENVKPGTAFNLTVSTDLNTEELGIHEQLTLLAGYIVSAIAEDNEVTEKEILSIASKISSEYKTKVYVMTNEDERINKNQEKEIVYSIVKRGGDGYKFNSSSTIDLASKLLGKEADKNSSVQETFPSLASYLEKQGKYYYFSNIDDIRDALDKLNEKMVIKQGIDAYQMAVELNLCFGRYGSITKPEAEQMAYMFFNWVLSGEKIANYTKCTALGRELINILETQLV